MPFFLFIKFTPSEKLSGVKFNIPKILGVFLKFKFEKFFFLILYFVNRVLFFFFKDCDKSCI